MDTAYFCSKEVFYMYVPILKARRTELGVIKKLSYCFSDKIIPLVEIINDKSDLDKILDCIDKRKIFIDYLRISSTKYGNRYDPNSVILSLEISRDENKYFEFLKILSNYNNIIPVISLSNDYQISKQRLEQLYTSLTLNKNQIALRITPSLIDNYKNFIQDKLSADDYLFFDIEETSILSREIELEELSGMNIKAKKIILNSPRESRLTNGEFEENDVSILINNCVATEYAIVGFDGFGDYCGYKDVLPRKNGSKGEGAALALIYNYRTNQFYSFVEKNTKLGLKGYNKVINDILQKKDMIGDFDDCIAMREVERLNLSEKKGNWSTWIGITITRYIYQMYLNLQ